MGVGASLGGRAFHPALDTQLIVILHPFLRSGSQLSQARDSLSIHLATREELGTASSRCLSLQLKRLRTTDSSPADEIPCVLIVGSSIIDALILTFNIYCIRYVPDAC